MMSDEQLMEKAARELCNITANRFYPNHERVQMQQKLIKWTRSHNKIATVVINSHEHYDAVSSLVFDLVENDYDLLGHFSRHFMELGLSLNVTATYCNYFSQDFYCNFCKSFDADHYCHTYFISDSVTKGFSNNQMDNDRNCKECLDNWLTVGYDVQRVLSIYSKMPRVFSFCAVILR